MGIHFDEVWTRPTLPLTCSCTRAGCLPWTTFLTASRSWQGDSFCNFTNTTNFNITITYISIATISIITIITLTPITTIYIATISIYDVATSVNPTTTSSNIISNSLKPNVRLSVRLFIHSSFGPTGFLEILMLKNCSNYRKKIQNI